MIYISPNSTPGFYFLKALCFVLYWGVFVEFNVKYLLPRVGF